MNARPHAQRHAGGPAGGWQGDPLLVDSAMHALALRLVAGRAMPVPVRHGLSLTVATRVAAMVEAGLNGPLCLADLATESGYSVAQFTRLFRVTFGTSALDYVTSRRIERACRMLRHGTRAQIEIALDCGFQSQQHFARVFRAKVGITPQAYRKQA